MTTDGAETSAGADTGTCELCNADTLCDRCRNGRVLFGFDLGTGPSVTVVSMFREVGRQLVHVVTGTPAQVVAEWGRLAEEEGRPT